MNCGPGMISNLRSTDFAESLMARCTSDFASIYPSRRRLCAILFCPALTSSKFTVLSVFRLLRLFSSFGVKATEPVKRTRQDLTKLTSLKPDKTVNFDEVRAGQNKIAQSLRRDGYMLDRKSTRLNSSHL